MQPAKTRDARPARSRAAAWLAGAGLRPDAAAAGAGRAARRRRPQPPRHRREPARGGAPATARRCRSPPSTTRCAPSAGRGLMQEVTVDGTRSYFDTRIDDHPHYYWEEDGRLTDAPNEAVRARRRAADPRGRRARPRRRGDPPAPPALSHSWPPGRRVYAEDECARRPPQIPSPYRVVPGGSRGAGEGPPRAAYAPPGSWAHGTGRRHEDLSPRMRRTAIKAPLHAPGLDEGSARRAGWAGGERGGR